MTNTEINKRIAELYLPCDYLVTNGIVELVSTITKLGSHGEPYEVVEKYDEFNPCEDWNQLMPLCIERGISLYRPKHINSDVWIASKYDSSKQQVHEDYGTNPQIALCLCLIKVLEAKEIENNG